MHVTQAADLHLAAGMPTKEVADRLAAAPAADRPRFNRDDLFRGFIDPQIPLTRTQWKRLRRLGFVPAMAGGQQAPTGVVAMLPFTSSSHEHTEVGFAQRTFTPGAGETAIDPIDIPAQGYLRHFLLQVDGAGGAGGTGNPDFPFGIFSNVTMAEVNGATIIGGAGFNGFDLFLTNLFGGYVFKQDPREAASYAGAAPNPSFTMRVPAEISSKDGLGALVNQNASALFKLTLSLAARATVMTVDWTTPPALTMRGWLEAWTLPASTDSQGRPQSQAPPLVGTAQYWSKRSKSVLTGSNTVELTRLGNLIRLLVYTARNSTGARDDTVFPDPITFSWDTVVLHSFSQRYMKQLTWEKVLTSQAALAGVFVLPFNHVNDGKMGNEDPNLWLGTTQASRIEINGNSVTGGRVDVMTNEVAPIESNPAAQFVTPNATGQLVQPASVQAAR